MHDQIGISSNRRGEMRIRRRGQGEVSFILLRVTRLLQRTQHQVRQNALLRLARDLLCQLLVHAWGYMHILGNLVLARIATAAMTLAALSACLEAPDRQVNAERISKGGGKKFEVVDALCIGLFVNAVKRSNVMILEMSGNALVGRQHEFFDETMGELPFRAL